MMLVTLTTDFGLDDPFVGIMKGVLATRAPGVVVVDVTHGIPPQDILAGALVLAHAVPFFPKGTVHLAVVDPGVGGPRRPLCVETDRGLLVGPDNGLLSLAAPTTAVRRIVHLVDERFFLSPRSTTFHGRDVFAPVAAALACGTPPDALGPAVADLVRLALPEPEATAMGVRGQVIYVDRFGNLVTNLSDATLSTFARRPVSITIGNRTLAGVATAYSSVEPGVLLAIVNSWGLLEIAVRGGSARDLLPAGVGAEVVLENRQ